jgi:hypothetical protein
MSRGPTRSNDPDPGSTPITREPAARARSRSAPAAPLSPEVRVRSVPVRVLSLVVAVALAALLVPTVAGAQQAEQRQLQQARDRLAQLSREIDTASS